MSTAPELDHLFRHATAQVVAALTRQLGAHHLDIAEEATQDAAVRALAHWRFHGVPANPTGWLYRAARNRALDLLRRDSSLTTKLETLVSAQPASAATIPSGDDAPFDAMLADAELALVFLCCHPLLSLDARLALTLKLAGGFTVEEIAAAFLAEPATIAQRIVRAKRTLAAAEDAIELIDPAAVTHRLESVLEALYLLFNEGYDAHAGDTLVRAELCGEAIRLMRLVVADARTDLPHADALLALMLYQVSRLPARSDAHGALVLLRDQDRTLWDARMIAEATRWFDRSLRGDRVTTWHVQAAIAATHAHSSSDDDTDWPAILALYDQLYALEPTPVVALNRAIARSYVDGPAAALADALPLLEHPAMRRYTFTHVTLASFAEQLGDSTAARAHYGAALRLRCNAVERAFMEAQLARLTEAGSRERCDSCTIPSRHTE